MAYLGCKNGGLQMDYEKIALLRERKIDFDLEIINFDAICLLSNISRSRGHKLAVSMFVDNFQDIITRRPLIRDLPFIE